MCAKYIKCSIKSRRGERFHHRILTVHLGFSRVFQEPHSDGPKGCSINQFHFFRNQVVLFCSLCLPVSCHVLTQYSIITQAKLGDELLDYKDLAALPKIKAIYNIDRPDMLTYSPYISYSAEDRPQGEVFCHCERKAPHCMHTFQ